MPLSRVTATLPTDLVKAADRLARKLDVSRSAVLAEALRTHLSRQPGRPASPGGVAEAAVVPYEVGPRVPLREASDVALLAELQRRLGAPPGTADPAVADALPGQARIGFHPAKIAELCRRHHIRRLSLFGSVLRDDFRPDSDVDVLVEFEREKTPGFGIIGIERELSEIFGGRRVDLVTKNALHRLIRDRVLAAAQELYAAA